MRKERKYPLGNRRTKLDLANCEIQVGEWQIQNEFMAISKHEEPIEFFITAGNFRLTCIISCKVLCKHLQPLSCLFFYGNLPKFILLLCLYSCLLFASIQITLSLLYFHFFSRFFSFLFHFLLLLLFHLLSPLLLYAPLSPLLPPALPPPALPLPALFVIIFHLFNFSRL